MYEFDEIADYYDAMYSDRIDDVHFYLDLAHEVGGPVLECGCGTGRILLPIAESGIEIVGLDGSQAMLSIAEEKVQKLEVEFRNRVQLSHQDMREFALDRCFRLCMVPFRAFLHLLTVEDQNKALRQIHQHLLPEGKLVLDVFVPSYEILAQGKTTIRIEHKYNHSTGRQFAILDHVRYEHASQLIRVERYYEEVDETGLVRRKVMPFTLRYVFRYEMQAQLEKNGFRIQEVFGQFDKRPYDYKSGEMIFVAEKEE